jgi:peptide/nickel transport system substrate-binding protein
MLNSLLQFNPWTFDRFDIWGDLAESWSQEDPLGTIWEFKIKPHATWWDGTSVTAEDVAYSFERMTGNTEGHPGAQGEAGLYVKPNYDRAEAVDATTVRIFLKNSWADFLGYMADDLIMMVPQHHYEPLDPQALEDPDLYKNIVNGRTTVMASGPFKPSNVIDKDQWSYRRNEIYWKKDPDGRNLPYLDGMDYFRVVDRTAAQAAWEAEQFDNTNWQTNGNMSPGQMVEMIENGGGKFVAYPAAISPRLLLVNTTQAPFDNPMVRKAVMLSIDRQAHNELVWGGLGVYGTICGPPSHPLCLGEEEVLKLPGFRQPKDQDWAEARRLLQEAGYEEGFTTSFITPNDLASQDEGPVLQDTLAKVGIDVDHIVLDRAGHNDARINGNFDTILNSSGAGVVTPDQYLNTFFLFENIGNPFDWRYCGPCIGEPDVDLHALIRQQSQALDPVERMVILRQIDDIVTLKDSGNIMMYIRSFARLFNADRVGGQMPTQSGYIETKAEQLWLLNP